jgi:hypothetical protein
MINLRKSSPQTEYPNLLVQEKVDLRPAMNSGWKLIEGYPRAATDEELKLFTELSCQDASQSVQVYKYTTYQRRKTILQIFTADHTYLGGGEYDTSLAESHTISDEEMQQLNAVGNF